ALPVVAFQSAEQLLLDLSQTSAQVGSEILATASAKVFLSLSCKGASISLYFLLCTQGSRPALQFIASTVSSSEYFQMSSVSLVKAACILACSSGLSLFQTLVLIT